ncbi:MAG TPA: helix-turn-helix transcriptional regulator [Anaerolineales bacterium]|jgi:transcriptional regulator with XRE-family HTH domain|nr:helix-turn-helix transcriptional regulator [Anaerolineales bacterium]
MDAASQFTLRTKKLGVLIRDARLASRRSPDECARAMGVSKGVLRAYEEGLRAPSLPELEALAYFLSLPLEHFWGKVAVSDSAPQPQTADLPQLVQLRQRMIGALLRQERSKSDLSIKTLSGETGIPAPRIKSYELGERPIPLPELEALAMALSARVEVFFDQSGPIGKWMWSQKSMKQFMELPPELQTFVSQPVNRPYLELAVKLSAMSSDKLRSVAEGLLDITL